MKKNPASFHDTQVKFRGVAEDKVARLEKELAWAKTALERSKREENRAMEVALRQAR